MGRADKLSVRGTLGRWGALRRAFMLPARSRKRWETRLLIDHNGNKLSAAESVWGPMASINPYEVTPRLGERLVLIVSQLFPDLKRRVIQGMGTAYSVKRVLPLDADLFIWNPTQILHHCLVECLGVEDCMVFNPVVPLPLRTVRYSGRKIVREVYGLPEARFNQVDPEFSKIRNDPRVAIYLSFLPEGPPIVNKAEARLVSFGLHLHDLGIATKFFFHYRDRNERAKIARFDLPLEMCDYGVSMDSLSTSQISISGSSTIGLDLCSIEVGHFFCIDTDHPPAMSHVLEPSPMANYLLTDNRSLRPEDSDDIWISTISAYEPIVWKKLVSM